MRRPSQRRGFRQRIERGAFAIGFVVMFAAFALGCSSNSGAQDAGAPIDVTSPLPAPEGLFARAALPTPDATWARTRTAIGGTAAFLPATFGGLAATLFGLPITSAGEIDGDVPVVAAFGSPGSGEARWVVGLHVKVGERFVDGLTKGEGARFTSTLDAATHVSVLASKTGAKLPAALGVLGNYLLVAPQNEALLALGPYVARTLPAMTMPKEDLTFDATEEALARADAGGLRAKWEKLKARIEEHPARVVVTERIDRIFDVLADVSAARLSLTLGADVLHARATLTPKAAGGVASKYVSELTVGDAKPLLELPLGTQIGGFVRRAKEQDADAQAAVLGAALGRQIADDEKQKIATALRAENEAAGAWVAFGFSLTPTGPAGFARMPVIDEAGMKKALGDLAALIKLPSVKARLDELDVAASTGKTAVANLPGEIGRVRLKKEPAKEASSSNSSPSAASPSPNASASSSSAKPGKSSAPAASAGASARASATLAGATPQEVELLYVVLKDVLVGAVAVDAKEALVTAANAKDATSLAGDSLVKSAVENLGADVSMAFMIDLPRLVAAKVGKPAPLSSAPIVLALGKGSERADLSLRIEIAHAALQELIKNRSAF